jgi:uncharacterized delta-60 repeat protein
MAMFNPSSRRTAAPERGRDHQRLRKVPVRGRRNLRPIAEDLEGRTLLSVGLDPTYGLGGLAPVVLPQNTTTTSYHQSFDAIALQNGQVVEVGTLTTSTTGSGGGSSTDQLVVSRLTTGGSVDSTFGSNGTTTIPLTIGGVTYSLDSPIDIAVQSSGKIDVLADVHVSSSGSTTEEFLVVQLNSSGTIDTTFGSSGATFIRFGPSSAPTDASPSALAIGPGGKIDAVGTTTTTVGQVFAIAQLTSGGALDTSFNGTGTATVNFTLRATSLESDLANDVVVQPNGAIVVVGSAQLTASSSSATTVTDAAVARLNPNGTLDSTFNPTGRVPGTLVYSYNLGNFSNDSANRVALQGSQIVIAGTTMQDSTNSTPTTPLPANLTVTRLNPNGSFDTTFNSSGKFMLSLNQAGIAFDTFGNSVTVLPSGNILVGGMASPFNTSSTTSSSGLLLEMTPNGAPDPSYGPNGVALVPTFGINSRLFVQMDGKVVFLSGSQVARTTAPTPAAATTTIITKGTGKKAKATGVTIRFNTAVNPNLLTSPSIYQVRPHGKKTLIKLKKKGISYNAATQTLTLTFASKTAIGKGFDVVVVTGGIIGADGQVLPSTPIVITPSST